MRREEEEGLGGAAADPVTLAPPAGPREGAPASPAPTWPFQAMFERAPDAIVVVRDQAVAHANPAARALLGLASEELPWMALAALDRSPDPTELARLCARLRSEGEARACLEVGRPDGSVRHIELAVRADVAPGVHMAILRDVTERTRRELMSERYELLTRHAHDIVLFVDKDGVIVEANDAALAAYGYGPELVGLNVRELRAEDTRPLVPIQMEAAFQTGVLFETVHRRKDGTTFPVEIGSRAAQVGSERLLLSIVRDLSERAEMRANLLHADRLAAVGMLAAGVAHEVNNPLAYAMGNLDMLARRLPDAIARLQREAAAPDAGTAARLQTLATELADAEEMLAVAREGAARVRTIVLDLRRFSRPDETLVGPSDVHDVLEYAIGIAVNEIRHRARMVREYGSVPAVLVNESRLGQVFLNVLVNAAQAIPEGRAADNEIRVRTTTDLRGRVVIEISDTGVGIPSALLGRVFDPFLTTKPAGEGTGLGLYISRSIVKDAGGEISVDSAEGRGTRVRIVLPSATSGSSPSLVAPHATTRPPPTPRRRLLVIDDEPAIARMVRAMLSSEHDIVVAESGREAMARLSSDAGFDVVLCDLMMPDLSGMDLFEQVAATLPELANRFVFMTGGAFTPRGKEIFARFPDRCLHKPFDADALRAIVDRLSSGNPLAPPREAP